MNDPELDPAASAASPPTRGAAAPHGGEEIIQMVVGRDLDLHTFRPRDLPDLLPEWFSECRRLGIPEVRVIHGKGTGALRSGVHALLPRLGHLVAAWRYPAPDPEGGWGATMVRLRESNADSGIQLL